MSPDIKELIKKCKELSDYAICMKLATNYRKDFNYSRLHILMQDITKNHGTKEDIEELYPCVKFSNK